MPKIPLQVDSSHAHFIRDMEDELERIKDKGYQLNSLHEGYALIQEEIEEAWEIIKKKPCKRCYKHLREELVQVASLALRMAVELKNMEPKRE